MRSIIRSTIGFALYGAVSLLIALFALSNRVVNGFAGDAVLPAECALVFGAAVHSDDDPGPGIRRRTLKAVELLKEGSVERLIFTGGKGSETQDSEASVMRDFAMRQGISASRIAVEEQSTSTWENLQWSKPMVDDCTTIVAVSDTYHLARIQVLAELQGWKPLPTVAAEGYVGTPFTVRSVARETIALFYYLIGGR